MQRVLLDVPVEKAWTAYTPDEGWSAWSSPLVEIDLRVAGNVRTNDDGTGRIGDPGTNTLRILESEYDEILDDFTTANEELLMHMRRYVEDGVRRTWGEK